jgi:Tfp pilus assembly protein PilX
MKMNLIPESSWKLTDGSRPSRDGRRGVALITALILLSVAMLLGLSLMLTTSSDVFISGTARNSKSAYYAADAGISVMRTALVSALTAATPASLSDYTQTIFPCNGTFSGSILNTALATVGGTSAQSLSSASSSGDLAATYAIDTSNDSTGQPRTSFTCVNIQAPTQPFAQNASRNELYTFAYQITSNGAVPGSAGNLAASSAIEKGTITYNLDVIYASPQYQNVLFSFAGYGMFIDQYDPHNGSTLLHGTVTGRVHTNGEWGFSTGSPNYVFTDPVSSVNQNAYFLFSSGYDRNSNSMTSGGQTIAPQFMSGFTRGVQTVPMPGNDNNQAVAVLNGAGFDPNNPLQVPPAPTSAQLAAALRNASGAAYSGSTGVYIPVQGSGSPPTYTTTGAGIYVKGTVSDMKLDARTSGLQILTITQGSTTTTVTYNLTTTAISGYPPQSTTIKTGSSTLTAPGLPTNVNPVNPNRDPSIQPDASSSVYVNGSINSLHGPGAGLSGVQDGMAMTVTATGDISITGDVLYKTVPVTETQGQVAPGVPANSPPGTLIPGNDNGQALGIFTSTGNIYVNVDNISSGNIEIDASLATLSTGGSGGVTVGGSSYANTLTIIGGRIQNQIMVLGDSGTVRNVFFDRRYANSAYAPPFFPATSRSIVQGTSPNGQYAVAPASSLQAIPTSYSVPSRLVAAANAGH